MYICHSLNKRETNAKAVICHMENWGFETSSVYENNELFLESDYHQIWKHIEMEKGVLIVLTSYLITDIEALIELDIIKRLFKDGKVKVFTFSYGIALEELPERMEWLKETNLMQIDGSEAIYEGICHIIECHLEQQMEKAGGIHVCRKVVETFIEKDYYLQQIFNDYISLEGFAIRTKIVLLYTMYCYISVKHAPQMERPLYGKCIKQLFQSVDYYEQCGVLQLKIVERSLLLLVCDIVKAAEN